MCSNKLLDTYRNDSTGTNTNAENIATNVCLHVQTVIVIRICIIHTVSNGSDLNELMSQSTVGRAIVESALYV